MKKKYYGILLAAVIAAGTMGVTAQAAELADTEKLTETANVTDDVNTANSTPPITGAGIQNLSSMLNLVFKNFPSISTTTATAIV